jgi:hypothetical protein
MDFLIDVDYCVYYYYWHHTSRLDRDHRVDWCYCDCLTLFDSTTMAVD